MFKINIECLYKLFYMIVIEFFFGKENVYNDV
jgi:hypothetical protein